MMEAAMGTPRSSAYECVGEYSWLPAWLPAVGSWRENSACDVKEKQVTHTHTHTDRTTPPTPTHTPKRNRSHTHDQKRE